MIHKYLEHFMELSEITLLYDAPDIRGRRRNGFKATAIFFKSCRAFKFQQKLLKRSIFPSLH